MKTSSKNFQSRLLFGALLLSPLVFFQNCSPSKSENEDKYSILMQPGTDLDATVKLDENGNTSSPSCNSFGKNGHARMHLNSPVKHQIFQRGSSAQNYSGPVYFDGVVSGDSSIDCIEVKYTFTHNNQQSPWIRITSKVLAANEPFRIPVGTYQGLYNISVRGINNGLIGEQYEIDRVGVGEVFIAAGQSNSSFAGDTPTETTSGHVSFFDGTEWTSCKDSTLHEATGASISAGARVDPFAASGNLGLPNQGRQGGSPWCIFGDSLYAYWRVPVAIVPIGVSGSNIFKWLPAQDKNVQATPPYPSYISSARYISSLSQNDPNRNANQINYAAAMAAGLYGYYNADNDPSNSHMSRPPGGGAWILDHDESGTCNSHGSNGAYSYSSCMRAGFPYARLVARLKYFARQGGMRAVLWHQGEGDVTYQDSMAWHGMDPNYYSKELSKIISQSRKDSGLPKLAWLISYVGVTEPQWRPGYTPAASERIESRSLGLFAPNTIPTRKDFDLIRVQQGMVVTNTWGTTPYVYSGVDSDSLTAAGGDGRDLYRSQASYPHFNQVGLMMLGSLWLGAVMTAFPAP